MGNALVYFLDKILMEKSMPLSYLFFKFESTASSWLAYLAKHDKRSEISIIWQINRRDYIFFIFHSVPGCREQWNILFWCNFGCLQENIFGFSLPAGLSYFHPRTFIYIDFFCIRYTTFLWCRDLCMLLSGSRADVLGKFPAVFNSSGDRLLGRETFFPISSFVVSTLGVGSGH